MFNCKKYNSFVNEHNSLKRVDNRISLCSVCNHYAHNECCIGNTFDSRRKLRRKKMCLMSNSIENGDRDPFLTSETFPGIPADSRAPSITIPFYKLDDMKYNTMTFNTMVEGIKTRLLRNCIDILTWEDFEFESKLLHETNIKEGREKCIEVALFK